MRPHRIGIDVASRFQVDSRDVSSSYRQEKERERENDEIERGGAKEVMKFKVTALKCTSHAENRKRGRMDFPDPRKNVNA
ncbi:hypothetical protein X777_01466 [Ooceraea biroi]|uniref:Uncharacterized protein n=1 Tax=Ooceraea biroi TaxID=2015173 RepID=A0A026WPY4_OOCBI|nr:hypothetical protein X777_01466 [Ooceraea biroi]